MSYSTISKKIGKCRLCPPGSSDKYLITDLCQYHYKTERSKVYLERQKERNKIRLLQNSPINKSTAENKKGTDIELQNYFKLAAEELSMNPFCWECNAKIPATIKRLVGDKWITVDNFRNCTCHIFPKALFHSVRANPYNKLYLCAANGCHDKTHRLDTFSKMKIFPEAVRLFRLFENNIKESNKYLHLFLEYANQI
jgi:hypothetical protein